MTCRDYYNCEHYRYSVEMEDSNIRYWEFMKRLTNIARGDRSLCAQIQDALHKSGINDGVAKMFDDDAQFWPTDEELAEMEEHYRLNPPASPSDEELLEMAAYYENQEWYQEWAREEEEKANE